MYTYNQMLEKDFEDLSELMRDLMVKWKEIDTNTVLKEISMPDMIGIMCYHSEVIDPNDFIRMYWDQIDEIEDYDISDRLRKIFKSHENTIKELIGSDEFTPSQLEYIIRNYIPNTPVIRVRSNVNH